MVSMDPISMGSSFDGLKPELRKTNDHKPLAFQESPREVEDPKVRSYLSYPTFGFSRKGCLKDG